jgi:hypothetical protein
MGGLMTNREELAEVISRLTPEDARSVEALREASSHAAEILMAELPAIRASIKVWPNTASAIRSEMANAAFKRARELRNHWLKANGAYARG